MSAEVARKTVNALIADAEMGFGAKFLVSATGLDATEAVVNGFKKAMGGLWVGGIAILYETKIAFRPNALNRAMHAGDYSVEIPLDEVSDIQVRFGFVTKIIDLVTAEGKLSIRCFGAPSFAQRIREQQSQSKRKPEA
ncbi:MAG: hypothetical protein KDB14_14720 [Planctomycetales bacterium]|nr:hypothetical protein [Planctomycetales bacterium]